MLQYAASVKGLHYLRMSNGYVSTSDEIKMLHKLYQKSPMDTNGLNADKATKKKCNIHRS